MEGEIEQWNLPNLNGKDKIGKKTIKRASGTDGTITKELIFVLLESWKEKAQGWKELEKMSYKIQNLARDLLYI